MLSQNLRCLNVRVYQIDSWTNRHVSASSVQGTSKSQIFRCIICVIYCKNSLDMFSCSMWMTVFRYKLSSYYVMYFVGKVIFNSVSRSIDQFVLCITCTSNTITRPSTVAFTRKTTISVCTRGIYVTVMSRSFASAFIVICGCINLSN